MTCDDETAEQSPMPERLGEAHVNDVRVHEVAGRREVGSEARTPVIRTVAMPADTNPAGDIFGGWLMAQMDLAAGSLATRHAKGRCATVAVDGMSFHSPVFVGDEVSLYASILGTGRSSMRISVEAWRRAQDGEETLKVTQATFTFVAIDHNRKTRPLPPMR